MRNRLLKIEHSSLKYPVKMYNFFGFNVSFFHWFGSPYLEKPKFRNLAAKIFWLFYKLIGDFMILLNTISVIIITVISTDDMGTFFAGSMAVTYNVGYYVRYVLYRSKMTEIMDVYENMNKHFNEYNKTDERFFKLYQSYHKVIKDISLWRVILEIGGCFFICGVCIIQGLYGIIYRAPSYAWYPFSKEGQPNNILINLFQLAAFSIVVGRASASDSFFSMVITFLGLQMKVLKMILADIMDKKQITSDDERRGKLIWWINRHREALRAISIFKEVMSPFLVNTYLVALLLILIGGVVTTSTESWDMYQKVTLITVGMLNLTNLFITCRAGDFLQEMELTLADEGYNSDLFLLAKKYQTAYRIIATRCKKLINFDAYGFHPLSSSNFSVLVRATFSYYLAIIQISQRSRNQE